MLTDLPEYPNARTARKLSNDSPKSRKYDNALTEVLDHYAECERESFGDCESVHGFVQLFALGATLGAIVRTDYQGFVTCEGFGTMREVAKAYREAEEAYSADAGDAE